jgi:hypothetical protein
MPYKRRYNRKYRKRKRGRKKIYGDAAGQLWKDVKYLKGLVNTETKFVSNSIGPTTVQNTSWQNEYISGLTQGDEYFQRDGNSVRVKKISANIKIENLGLGNTAQTIRLILVRESAPRGALPSMSEVFVTPASGNLVLSKYNPLEMTGYSILFDKKYTVTKADRPVIYDTFFKAADFHMEYNGTTATISDQTKCSLTWFFISDQPTSNRPEITIESRVNYIDN